MVVRPTADDSHLFTAITLGASACITRDTAPEFLLSTLRQVHEGEHPIQYDLLSHADATERLLQWLRDYPTTQWGSGPPSPLSPRETLVLEYVAQGYSNKEIGTPLGVTEQMVENYLSTILRKANAKDRAHAAVLALMNGWIILPERRLETDGSCPPSLRD